MANANLALLETGLMRAADRLGDITPGVMARFGTRFPGARDRFAALCSYQGPARLEEEMVGQALYCLMHWLDSPQEIEIILYGSVPHHAETLSVPPALYAGLLEAVCDEIVATVPADEAAELHVWHTLRADLLALIDRAALN